jgi:hypothetical protein
MLEHLRLRRHVALLASGALSGAQERVAQAHVQACTRCRSEFEALRSVVDAIAQDPLQQAEPEIPLSFLVARVNARLDQQIEAAPSARGWRFLALPIAAATALALVVLMLPAIRSLLTRARPIEVATAEVPQLSPESLARLDRTLAREQTARYLNEAQDVLVTVAATPPHCKRGHEQLDIADEARRSRALLQRRSLYTELADEHAPSAEPVLHDVERVLREVAALDDCSRPAELQAIHRELTEGRLLMKLTLVQRELLG